MPHFHPKRVLIGMMTVVAFVSVYHFFAIVPVSQNQSDAVEPKMEKSQDFYERSVKVFAPEQVLLPYVRTAPDTINYIWCGDKLFQFRHYLSMLSMFKVQQPNKVIIHWYSGHPLLKDANDYNLWFWQLTENYYNVLMEMRPNDMPDCANETQMMQEMIDILSTKGGIYINETVMINKDLHSLRWQDISIGVFDESKSLSSSNIAYIVAKQGYTSIKHIQDSPQSECQTSSRFHVLSRGNTTTFPDCTLMDSNLNPADIMEAPNVLSSYLRYIYYGSAEKRFPAWSMDDPIPNIGHMVLLGGNEMNFLSYLSIRSMIHCVRADAMYIYIDQEPKGKWYEKLKGEEPRAVFVYHEWPGAVFGKPMSDGSHSSDLMRFDLLYRYGGIYVDWDAVMLKPLGDLRGYSFVTDFDWPDWHPPYPDVINNGVSAGKKGSVFLKKCLKLFKKYNPKGDWYYNGLMMPYKVYEQYPEHVKIETKLQVICYNLKCHPIWLPGYHDENIHHLNGANFQWNEVYAFHWTRPSPPELLDPELMKTSDTMFAEVGRYIMSCKRDDS